MRAFVIVVTVWAVLGMINVASAQTVFNLDFSDTAEVPDPGDPDDLGTGTVTVWPDHGGSPIYGAIGWNILYANLDIVHGMHLHGPMGLRRCPGVGGLFHSGSAYCR